MCQKQEKVNTIIFSGQNVEVSTLIILTDVSSASWGFRIEKVMGLEIAGQSTDFQYVISSKIWGIKYLGLHRKYICEYRCDCNWKC